MAKAAFNKKRTLFTGTSVLEKDGEDQLDRSRNEDVLLGVKE
jgi:hypothetical protein